MKCVNGGTVLKFSLESESSTSCASQQKWQLIFLLQSEIQILDFLGLVLLLPCMGGWLLSEC